MKRRPSRLRIVYRPKGSRDAAYHTNPYKFGVTELERVEISGKAIVAFGPTKRKPDVTYHDDGVVYILDKRVIVDRSTMRLPRQNPTKPKFDEAVVHFDPTGAKIQDELLGFPFMVALAASRSVARPNVKLVSGTQETGRRFLWLHSQRPFPAAEKKALTSAGFKVEHERGSKRWWASWGEWPEKIYAKSPRRNPVKNATKKARRNPTYAVGDSVSINARGQRIAATISNVHKEGGRVSYGVSWIDPKTHEPKGSTGLSAAQISARRNPSDGSILNMPDPQGVFGTLANHLAYAVGLIHRPEIAAFGDVGVTVYSRSVSSLKYNDPTEYNLIVDNVNKVAKLYGLDSGFQASYEHGVSFLLYKNDRRFEHGWKILSRANQWLNRHHYGSKDRTLGFSWSKKLGPLPTVLDDSFSGDVEADYEVFERFSKAAGGKNHYAEIAGATFTFYPVSLAAEGEHL